MKKTLFNEGYYFSKNVVDMDHIDLSAMEKVVLPHTWNKDDGQDGGNDYYRGKCYYVRQFEKPELNEEELWIEFEAVAMSAEVYLNGKLLGKHEGGYSTFRVNLTEDLKDDNLLVISADNSQNQRVYPQSADFTFYGGIYRDVYLLRVPKLHFQLGHYGSSAVKVTPVIEGTNAKVLAEAWLENGDTSVTFETDGQSITVYSKDGYAKAEFVIENVHLWDGIDDPYLYEMKASIDGDERHVSYGCRSFEIDAQRGFILNGREYPLRGVSRHQDRLGFGNALTKAMHEEDIELIREIGANSIRLAHYQHAQYFYDLCDRYGLIVWAEIPYITMHMSEGRENTISQMKELVIQNYNHPCIVVWGLSNEITAASAVSEDLLENHRILNDLVHSLDQTRPTTMADVFMLETDSPILDIPDVNAYNLYFGWYVGVLEQNEEFFDEWHQKYPNKPIGFSEYGADTNPQFYSSAPEKGDYSQSYQCVYHEHMLKLIEERPWLWCSYVWNMFDFAADGRDEGGKHGQNQKGLVTMDRKIRKDAFYLYKAYWSKEPFVYIAAKGYQNRNENKTQIKVYSNQDEVGLYVNGQLIESKKAHRVFLFDVDLSSKIEVKAVSGDLCDEAEFEYVDERDLSYVLNKQAAVTNWFDQNEIDETCFSVNDTFGSIMADPKTGAVINQMMAKMTASRGDVAESASQNPALQKMLARMRLIDLLKQAGEVDPETVKQLNRILQQFKKN
ncbi:MAG: hypothetical protein IKS54_04400 [Erysipelotrichaceae bacterium]|nr:hypothetical protein [Erysipelotrichaceae bacterium]